MSEYIKREVAIELLKEIKTHVPDDLETCVQVSIDVVNAIPAADVEPVVRCKECVNSRELYGDGLESVYNEMWCEDSGRIVIENGFCECGERSGGI